MLKNRSRKFWLGVPLLIIVLVALDFLFSAYQVDNRVVRATELFSTGRMVSLQVHVPGDDFMLGWIAADQRLFLIQGRATVNDVTCILPQIVNGVMVAYAGPLSCRIVSVKCSITKVVGGAIKDYTGPVACRMVYDGGIAFTGWVDFRNHHREFCGGNSSENLPGKCKWGSE